MSGYKQVYKFLADFGVKLEADPHAEEFLVEQLRAIGHIDPHYVLRRLAEAAVGATDLFASRNRPHDNIGHTLACLADVHLGEVTKHEEALMQVGS